MSTRCQVIVRDSRNEQVWFYRHCDGYPEGVAPTLNAFLDLVKAGKIRDNVEQACGWIVIIGAVEYQTVKADCFDKPKGPVFSADGMTGDDLMGWQAGAYEPCPNGCVHGDIEYAYLVDLEEKAIYQLQLTTDSAGAAIDMSKKTPFTS